MYLDKQTLFSENQAITADAVSTNIYDTGSAKDSGPGYPVEVFVLVKAAFNNLTSLTFSLQTATDAAFTSPVNLQDVTVALAGLTAGAKVSFSVLPEGCLRYLRLNYNVNGTNPSTGAITAGLILDRQTND